jgi:hypothetical protein
MSIDERTASMLEDLRALGDADARDERFGADLGESLRTRALAYADRPGPAAPVVPARRSRRFRSLATPVAALLVLVIALAFLLASHRGASPQAFLRRVAAITFGANQARHLVYGVTVTRLSGRVTHGTAEIWIATDASGKPVQATETLRLPAIARESAAVIQGDEQTPLGMYTYDGAHNVIVVPSRNDPSWSGRATARLPLPVNLFDGTTIARRLAELASEGAAHVQLRAERVVDGATVDPIQVDGWPDGNAARTTPQTTLYFDAGTHLLRGFDIRGNDSSPNSPVWHVRLAKLTEGPRLSAPRAAFALGAPDSAYVAPLPPDMRALVRLCQGQPKLLLMRGRTLLSACRAGNPAVSADTLVAALVGSAGQDLADAVAVGAITPAQARAALQAQRTQIRYLVHAQQWPG